MPLALCQFRQIAGRPQHLSCNYYNDRNFYLDFSYFSFLKLYLLLNNTPPLARVSEGLWRRTALYTHLAFKTRTLTGEGKQSNLFLKKKRYKNIATSEAATKLESWINIWHLTWGMALKIGYSRHIRLTSSKYRRCWPTASRRRLGKEIPQKGRKQMVFMAQEASYWSLGLENTLTKSCITVLLSPF